MLIIEIFFSSTSILTQQDAADAVKPGFWPTVANFHFVLKIDRIDDARLSLVVISVIDGTILPKCLP
jgi:hypothetical protein